MNTTLLILQALGYQGGTIHQASKETGLSVDQILNLDKYERNELLRPVYTTGWVAVRTCSVKFNKEVNFPKFFGNIDFWAGVVRGLYLKQWEEGKTE